MGTRRLSDRHPPNHGGRKAREIASPRCVMYSCSSEGQRILSRLARVRSRLWGVRLRFGGWRSRIAKQILLPCVVALGATVAGCATPVYQPKADPGFTSVVKSSPASPGTARLYAFLGTYRGFLFDLDHRISFDFSVNGLNLGRINKDECLVLDVKPGTYSVSFVEAVDGRTANQTFTLVSGQSAFLAIDIKQSVGTFFGLIGALAVPDTFHIFDRSGDGLRAIQNMTIVLPNDWNLALLKPMGAN